MKDNLVKAIQDQINKELYSSYLYLSMSSWADSESWKGLSNWLRIQSKEEYEHAMALHDNLLERGERSVFTAIEQPPKKWDSPLDCFKEVYKHEQSVTESINNLASIAMKENDHAFYQFVQWFVKEQVEEEGTVSEYVARFKRIKDNHAMMDQLDIELGKRVFVSNLPN